MGRQTGKRSPSFAYRLVNSCRTSDRHLDTVRDFAVKLYIVLGNFTLSLRI